MCTRRDAHCHWSEHAPATRGGGYFVPDGDRPAGENHRGSPLIDWPSIYYDEQRFWDETHIGWRDE